MKFISISSCCKALAAVEFCKDLWLHTMGLETWLCHTHDHHHHPTQAAEYQRETNGFLSVFLLLTDSTIIVIVLIKTRQLSGYVWVWCMCLA